MLVTNFWFFYQKRATMSNLFSIWSFLCLLIVKYFPIPHFLASLCLIKPETASSQNPFTCVNRWHKLFPFGCVLRENHGIKRRFVREKYLDKSIKRAVTNIKKVKSQICLLDYRLYFDSENHFLKSFGDIMMEYTLKDYLKLKTDYKSNGQKNFP